MSWRSQRQNFYPPGVIPRYPILSLIAAVFIFVGALPAAADDLDSAVAAARGSSLPILNDAEAVAGSSAAAQAASQKTFHTDVTSLLGACNSVAEIVGMGPNVEQIFDQFAGSSWHWSVITSSKWTSMGTGQTRGADGYLYLSVVFCEGAGTPTPPPPASPPAPHPPEPTPTASTPVSHTSVTVVPFDRELCPLITGGEFHDDLGESFCII